MVRKRKLSYTGMGEGRIIERILFYDAYIEELGRELLSDDCDLEEVHWCIADAMTQRGGLEMQLHCEEHWHLAAERGETAPEYEIKIRTGTHQIKSRRSA